MPEGWQQTVYSHDCSNKSEFLNDWWVREPSEHLVNNILSCFEVYMRTLARVSGSRSPTKPPPTSTDDASRMGMAFVMPTSEPKIRLPSTAASLHIALQKPKPVPLKTQGQWAIRYIYIIYSFNDNHNFKAQICNYQQPLGARLHFLWTVICHGFLCLCVSLPVLF